jgi:hypothetical protein
MYVQRKRTGTGKNEGGWLVEVVSGCQGVAVWVRGPWQDRTSGASQAMGSVASTTAQFQLRRRPYAPLASHSSVSAITARSLRRPPLLESPLSWSVRASVANPLACHVSTSFYYSARTVCAPTACAAFTRTRATTVWSSSAAILLAWSPALLRRHAPLNA